MSSETDLEQLYKDACFIHLVQKGLSEFMAEVETNRIIMRRKKGL